MFRPRFHQFWMIVLGLLFGNAQWPANLAASEKKTESPLTAQLFPDPTNLLGAVDSGLPRIEERQLIVRFRPGPSRAEKEAMLVRFSRSFKPISPAPEAVTKLGLGGKIFPFLEGLVVIDLKEEMDARAVLKELNADPVVLYAEPNYRIQATEGSPQTFPNDFDFGTLWGLHNRGDDGGKEDVDIDAPEAWRLSLGNTNVVVAVIDTGIDYFHPDLEENIWVNPREIPSNGTDDDHNHYIDDQHGFDFVSTDSDPFDDNGHGTHVAGIIGAKGGNKRGVAGVCWSVSLMALKILDDAGSGDVATAIEAIAYAVSNGARLINASWGTEEKSKALEEAIREAESEGVLFVGAAGNQGNDHPFYPAAYGSVIAVGAIDRLGVRGYFSNFGDYVDLAAPGDTIYSTVPNNSYTYLSGTSMAAPHVTGAAALVMARHPEFTSEQVRNILLNSADPLPAELQLGNGLIKAYQAVRRNHPLPDAQLNLPASVFGTVDLAGTAQGAGFARYTLAYGEGSNPTNWTTFHESAQPVKGGILRAGFDTGSLRETAYTILLTVEDAEGDAATDRAVVTIQNVHITSPVNNDVLRAGEIIEIRGTVFGQNRTYALEYGVGWQPKEWLTNGIQLVDGGQGQIINSRLGTLDSTLLQTNEFYTLRLTARDASQQPDEHIVHMIYLDGQLKPGWPQHIPAEADYPSEDWRDIKVADLDGDGKAELVLVDPGNSEGKKPRLLVYRYTGELLWQKEFPPGQPYSDIPLVGDMDGDGKMEIFVDVGAERQIYGFRSDGSTLPGWPVAIPVRNLAKVMADLDRDGRSELIGYSQDASGGQRLLLVVDHSGAIRAQWNLPFCDLNPEAPELFPAVGNLDPDPDLEIVAVSGCHGLALFDLKEPIGPVWAVETDGNFMASPAIGDLDHDGKNEIVLGSFSSGNEIQGGLYAFNRQGKLLPGWPVLLDESFAAPPALADFDGDGDLEISIPSWPSRNLHLIHHDGFEAEGWPVPSSSKSIVRSSSVIGDVDGDGQIDVLIPSLGLHYFAVKFGDLSSVGGVKAWNFHGQNIDLNVQTNLSSIVMESSGGPWLKAAALTLCDIDQNGKLDIVASTIQDLVFPPGYPAIARKGRGSIYVWELATPFRPESFPWPSFQANPQHTGALLAPPRPNHAPLVDDIPDQAIRTGSRFIPIELDRYVTDLEDPRSEISWTVSGSGDLRILIDTQRVAQIELPFPDWAGNASYWFIATDPAGLAASNAVHFASSPDYQPPIAAVDTAVLLEDESVEIDLLANDFDPKGEALEVVNVSRPENGRLKSISNGKWQYTPLPDFAGADHFDYTIRTASGSIAQGLATVSVVPVNDPPLALEDKAITLENLPITIAVLDNDEDADGDPLRVADYSQPASGTVTLLEKRGFRYTPLTNFAGADRFTYVVEDPAGLFTEGTVSIMVKPVNEAPTLQDQSFVLHKNLSQTVGLPHTDVDGDPLTFRVVDGPSHGELWLYPNVAIYFPNHDFVGEDRFILVAHDYTHESEPASVSFSVIGQNNTPFAEDQSVRVKPAKPVKIFLKGKDADQDPLDYRIGQFPQHGRIEGQGTNYLYRSDPGFVGTDQFTFRVADAWSASPEATVQITVTDINTPPLASDSAVTVFMNETTPIPFVASDGESDALTFEIVTPPAKGQLIVTDSETVYIPETDFAGSDRFTFKAHDGEAESPLATVTIAVKFPNEPPKAQNQKIFARKNRTARGVLRVSDPDGNLLRSPIVKGPRHGVLSLRGTNLVYQPHPNYVGNDSFTYKSWDGYVYSNPGTVSITVYDDVPPSFKAFKVLPSGDVALTLKIVPGANVRLESSTNLLDWVPVAVKTAEEETLTFIETAGGKGPSRFYRALEIDP